MPTRDIKVFYLILFIFHSSTYLGGAKGESRCEPPLSSTIAWGGSSPPYLCRATASTHSLRSWGEMLAVLVCGLLCWRSEAFPSRVRKERSRRLYVTSRNIVPATEDTEMIIDGLSSSSSSYSPPKTKSPSKSWSKPSRYSSTPSQSVSPTSATSPEAKRNSGSSSSSKPPPINTNAKKSPRAASSASQDSPVMGHRWPKPAQRSKSSGDILSDSWSTALTESAQQRDVSRFTVTLKNLAFKNQAGDDSLFAKLLFKNGKGKDRSQPLLPLIRRFADTPLPPTELSEMLWSLPRVGFKIRNPVSLLLSLSSLCFMGPFRTTAN